jgi:L-alanine-DL-glutamate epimerase-like enolase superfamily enzyme
LQLYLQSALSKEATPVDISRLYAVPFALPLNHPIVWTNGSISSAEHVLIVVETTSGLRGYAEAIPRPMHYGETIESIVAAVRTFVSPAVEGVSLLDRAAIAYRLRDVANNNSVRAAVDTAIWDALGKSLGVPVHRLLGGFSNKVAVSAVIGGGDIDKNVLEAQSFAADYGVRSFKVKVGWDLKKDADLVRALRMEMPDVHLCVDANHGFSAADALDFLKRTADCGIAWIEEPSPASDTRGRLRVYERCDIGILGDESCRDAEEVVAETTSGRSSMVSIKIARTGITESERIRGFCEAYGAQMVIGNQGDSAIGTWASVSYAAANRSTSANPAEMAYFLHLDDQISNAPKVEDGYVEVSDEPGFGISLNVDKLQEYATHHHLSDLEGLLKS